MLPLKEQLLKQLSIKSMLNRCRLVGDAVELFEWLSPNGLTFPWMLQSTLLNCLLLSREGVQLLYKEFSDLCSLMDRISFDFKTTLGHFLDSSDLCKSLLPASLEIPGNPGW